MKNILICIMVTLLGSQAFAQSDDIDPQAASQKAREDTWATATKAKAANDAAVAAQKAAEEKNKTPANSEPIVHIYDGKKGGVIPK